ncbi:astakine-like [Hylaeus anthracinus]|uniref:astakine-like n=1 Tax=Hylaeus anthracinus TaxID=313031 RepID=UPI0023BA29B0|nr:astakine-like [Hylaeus anthracinus]
MMAPIFVTSFLLFVSSYLSCAESRPDYIHCVSNSECELGHCCSIGPIRYSVPQCSPMKEEGEECRPGSANPVNMTVSYPDLETVELTDVHYIFCPCAHGLSCDRGICKRTGEEHDRNHLIGENNDD